jgi:hypothetical protein
MSNIVEPQIVETNLNNIDWIKKTIPLTPDFMQQNKGEPYVFLKDFSFTDSVKGAGSNTYNYEKGQVVYPFPQPLANEKLMPNPVFTKAINEGVLVPQKMQQQQVLMQQEVLGNNNRLTDKVFGKSQQGAGLDPQRIRVGAYMILGAVAGRYVAKNMGKSTTLGIIIGGLAPLLAYQLSLEYDRRNMPKQEPRQKVAVEPTSNKPITYPSECSMRYDLLPKKAVMMPQEYWEKQKEDWMKNNCK